MTQAPTSLNWSVTLPSSKPLASPARNELGGSDRTLGKRKRSVPRNMAVMVAMNAAHPEANQEPYTENMKKRRLGPPLAGGLGGAGLAGGLGLAAAAGGAVAADTPPGAPSSADTGSGMRLS